MSNLKHLSLKELQEAKKECQEAISYHGSKKSGQEERLKWIEKYIGDKTPRIKEGGVYRHGPYLIVMVTLIQDSEVFTMFRDGSCGRVYSSLEAMQKELEQGHLVELNITTEEFIREVFKV